MIGVPNCTPIARILPRVGQRFNGQSISETLYISQTSALLAPPEIPRDATMAEE
jgi:hypothetical protein